MKNTAHIDQKALSKRQQSVVHSPLPIDHVYHEIVGQLLSRLNLIRIQPEAILNVGWHLQHAAAQLQQRYPAATIKNVHDRAAIERCEDESVDLIIAHFALLAEPEPLYLLREFSRVLSQEGLLLFTSLGPDTFWELRESFLAVDRHVHVHPFTDMHDVGDWIRALQFDDPVMDREVITLAYEDLDLFFDDLKSAGVTNAHQARSRGLMSKNKWYAMLSQYAQFKTDDYFPATIEVVYGHGWKVKLAEDNNGLQGEIAISVDQIKRK